MNSLNSPPRLLFEQKASDSEQAEVNEEKPGTGLTYCLTPESSLSPGPPEGSPPEPDCMPDSRPVRFKQLKLNKFCTNGALEVLLVGLIGGRRWFNLWRSLVFQAERCGSSSRSRSRSRWYSAVLPSRIQGHFLRRRRRRREGFSVGPWLHPSAERTQWILICG